MKKNKVAKSSSKKPRARRGTKLPDKLRTACDAALAAGVIGCVRGGPKDFSNNPKYFEGFGEDRRRI